MTGEKKITLLSGAVMACGLAVGSHGIVETAAASDFYKGKNVRILIGHSLGGSYGGYAQLAAAHFHKHLGAAKVVVESRPGGGGRKAGKYFFSKAPTDGRMIALLSDVMAHNQLLEPKRAPWDMRKVNYIGRIATSGAVIGVRADTGVKDIKGLLSTTLKAGCSGKTSASATVPLLIKNLDGAKFQMVCGYRGSGPFMLALRRGEVNMVALNWGTWAAKLSDELAAGRVIPLLQAGETRNKLIPNIPLIQEVIGDARSKKIYEWVGLSSNIGRSLIGPPNLPKQRLVELRSAFAKLIKDKDFIAAIKKAKFPYDPAPGAEIDKLRDKVLTFDKKLVKVAAKAMREGYKKGCLNCGGKKKKK